MEETKNGEAKPQFNLNLRMPNASTGANPSGIPSGKGSLTSSLLSSVRKRSNRVSVVEDGDCEIIIVDQSDPGS